MRDPINPGKPMAVVLLVSAGTLFCIIAWALAVIGSIIKAGL